jgi:hypothetical protein
MEEYEGTRIMDTSDLYNSLTNFGSVIQLRNKLVDTKELVRWTEDNFKYVPYNPRKKVERFGLSLTSLDGGVTGVPDLDSLKEYNKEHGTNYTEHSFDIPTPVLDHNKLQQFVEPIKNDIFRSHILKLDPGGFFPPHRDYYATGTKSTNFASFRIIVPLQNFNPPRFNFVLEDKILHWEAGYMYFMNTAKVHYFFNASFDPSYWIVFNVNTTKETVDFIIRNVEFG